MDLNHTTSPAKFAGSAHAGGDGIATARRQIDARLGQLWNEILVCGDLRADDDFFDLGGDSLAATTLMRRIQEIFVVELPVAALLTHSTFGGMSGWIAQKQQQAAAPSVT